MLTDAQKAQFKKSLEKEKALLESELAGLGTGKPEGDEFGADRNDNADIIEDMEEDSATVTELEGRMNLVLGALEKMEEGTYGICEVCGADIEHDRLAANHAATTCKAHMQ